eukprot:5455328-Amphidinium_carterae.1
MWRRIRAVHPDRMPVHKVRAHRSHEDVAGDEWEELLWCGNGLADLSAMDEDHEQQLHVARGRRKRRSWLAPEWLQRLAELGPGEVMPAGSRGVAGNRAHRDLPMARVAQRGLGHAW